MSSSPIPDRRKGIGHGLAIVVSGPSGAGKNSVIDRVMRELPNLSFSVSHTTRPQRAGETHGVNYFFVSQEEFDRLLDADEFLEHVTYLGDRYGTTRSQLERLFAAGQDVLLNVDVEGAKTLRRRGLDPHTVVYVFLVPSSLRRLADRLRARGTEAEEEIEERLRVAAREMKALDVFDYLVINDELETAVEELRAIILAERLRVLRRG